MQSPELTPEHLQVYPAKKHTGSNKVTLKESQLTHDPQNPWFCSRALTFQPIEGAARTPRDVGPHPRPGPKAERLNPARARRPRKPRFQQGTRGQTRSRKRSKCPAPGTKHLRLHPPRLKRS